MAWTKEKAAEYSREYYQWAKDHHICVECKREKALYGRVRCYDCAEKARIRSKKEDREKINLKYRQRYAAWKSEGICVRCHKRPAQSGKVHCAVCLGHYRVRDKEVRLKRGHMPCDMMGDGYYCAVCGKQVQKKGDKLCSRCYDNILAMGEKGRKVISENRKEM